MPLTDRKILATKPRDKEYSLKDIQCLFMLITKNGSKIWQVRYMIDGQRCKLNIGTYPLVSIAEARKMCVEVLHKREHGVDSAEERQREKQQKLEARESTFRAVTIEWLEKLKQKVTVKCIRQTTRRFEHYVFRPIGQKDISEVTARELLPIFERLERSVLCIVFVYIIGVTVFPFIRSPGIMPER